jgi:putative acetyltransferase
LRELLREYIATLPEGVCQEEPVERSIEVYLKEPNGAWVAYSDGAAIGCIGLRFFRRDTARIERLYVRQAFRRSGVARSLCRTALRHAVRRDVQRVVLDTLPQMTAARELYRALGFVETTSPDWEGCATDDRIYMVLDLARER